jgi:gluconate 2-dehydrogenase gamma chain
MNRREFLQCAAILVSGAAVSQMGLALTQEQLTYLATAPDYIARTVSMFDAEQRRFVAAVADTIIPRTDSPGAIDAGVPRFIELMVADWFTDQERSHFMAGLGTAQQQCEEEFGRPFQELGEQQRAQFLEALEAAAASSPWYQQGSAVRGFVSDAPFICHMKELTAWGFFTSEAGASKVLRYDPMPMRFDGEVPLGPDESSWANYRV